MTNNQEYQKWDNILILSQIIFLIVAFGFISQQRYSQAAGLLLFPGGIIGLGKHKNPTIKFLNRMILSLAVVISVYWLYLEFSK